MCSKIMMLLSMLCFFVVVPVAYVAAEEVVPAPMEHVEKTAPMDHHMKDGGDHGDKGCCGNCEYRCHREKCCKDDCRPCDKCRDKCCCCCNPLVGAVNLVTAPVRWVGSMFCCD